MILSNLRQRSLGCHTHPNSAGHKVMAPLTEAAIAKALAHKQKK
ncbi:MAG: hypothetical protein ACHP9S_01530 [Terriglobales bacterium]